MFIKNIEIYINLFFVGFLMSDQNPNLHENHEYQGSSFLGKKVIIYYDKYL